MNYNFRNITCNLIILCLYNVIWVSHAQNNKNCNLAVIEESRIDSVVGNVLKDISLSLDTTLRIYKTDEKIDSLFKFSPSTPGELRIAKQIDREQLCPGLEKCLLNLSLIATEKEKKDSEIWIKLVIDVLDINDSRPKFPVAYENEPFLIEVTENQIPANYVIDLPKAYDADTLRFGIRSYYLEDLNSEINNFWQDVLILAPGHKLRIQTTLDFEKNSLYEFALIAVESDAPENATRARLPIKMVVKDLNDNSPIFEPIDENDHGSYKREISENTPITSPIITFKAKDADSSDNGRVGYKLVQASDYLRIDSNTGNIWLTKHLKAHEVEKIETLVTAYDHGTPQRTSNKSLVINVKDYNDHAPEITYKPIGRVPKRTSNNEIYIRTNAKMDSLIAFIFVEDLDLDLNGDVECKFQPQNKNPYSSDILNYELNFTRKKDRKYYYSLKLVGPFKITSEHTKRQENNPRYANEHVVINCTDKGFPNIMSSTLKLRVRILDDSEIDLQFYQSSYSIELQESGQPINNFLELVVQKSDGPLEYRLKPVELDSVSPCLSLITVDPKTGYLSAPNGLDREHYSNIICQVEVQERAKSAQGFSLYNTATTTVNILVVDINDNVPYFSPDLLINGLNFTEYDALTQSDYSLELSQSKIEIGRIQAFDLDENMNGAVTYHLIETKRMPSHQIDNYLRSSVIYDEKPNIFIDENTGLVSVLASDLHKMDRELTERFELTVVARDKGSPSLETHEVIQLYLKDVNDNIPMWLDRDGSISQKNFHFGDITVITANEIEWVMSSSNPDIRMTQLKALDFDQGENATLSFSLNREALPGSKPFDKTLIPRSAMQVFADGQVRLTTTALDMEKEYICYLVASDMGKSRQLISNAVLFIKLSAKSNLVYSDDPSHSNGKTHSTHITRISPFDFNSPQFISNKQMNIIVGSALILILLFLALSVFLIAWTIQRKTNGCSQRWILRKNKNSHYVSGQNKTLMGTSPLSHSEFVPSLTSPILKTGCIDPMEPILINSGLAATSANFLEVYDQGQLPLNAYYTPTAPPSNSTSNGTVFSSLQTTPPYMGSYDPNIAISSAYPYRSDQQSPQILRDSQSRSQSDLSDHQVMSGTMQNTPKIITSDGMITSSPQMVHGFSTVFPDSHLYNMEMAPYGINGMTLMNLRRPPSAVGQQISPGMQTFSTKGVLKNSSQCLDNPNSMSPSIYTRNFASPRLLNRSVDFAIKNNFVNGNSSPHSTKKMARIACDSSTFQMHRR